MGCAAKQPMVGAVTGASEELWRESFLPVGIYVFGICVWLIVTETQIISDLTTQ